MAPFQYNAQKGLVMVEPYNNNTMTTTTSTSTSTMGTTESLVRPYVVHTANDPSTKSSDNIVLHAGNRPDGSASKCDIVHVFDSDEEFESMNDTGATMTHNDGTSSSNNKSNKPTKDIYNLISQTRDVMVQKLLLSEATIESQQSKQTLSVPPMDLGSLSTRNGIHQDDDMVMIASRNNDRVIVSPIIPKKADSIIGIKNPSGTSSEPSTKRTARKAIRPHSSGKSAAINELKNDSKTTQITIVGSREQNDDKIVSTSASSINKNVATASLSVASSLSVATSPSLSAKPVVWNRLFTIQPEIKEHDTSTGSTSKPSHDTVGITMNGNYDSQLPPTSLPISHPKKIHQLPGKVDCNGSKDILQTPSTGDGVQSNVTNEINTNSSSAISSSVTSPSAAVAPTTGLSEPPSDTQKHGKPQLESHNRHDALANATSHDSIDSQDVAPLSRTRPKNKYRLLPDALSGRRRYNYEESSPDTPRTPKTPSKIDAKNPNTPLQITTSTIPVENLNTSDTPVISAQQEHQLCAMPLVPVTYGTTKKLMVYRNKAITVGNAAYVEMIRKCKPKYLILRDDQENEKNEIISTIINSFEYEIKDPEKVYEKVKLALTKKRGYKEIKARHSNMSDDSSIVINHYQSGNSSSSSGNNTIKSGSSVKTSLSTIVIDDANISKNDNDLPASSSSSPSQPVPSKLTMSFSASRVVGTPSMFVTENTNTQSQMASTEVDELTIKSDASAMSATSSVQQLQINKMPSLPARTDASKKLRVYRYRASSEGNAAYIEMIRKFKHEYLKLGRDQENEKIAIITAIMNEFEFEIESTEKVFEKIRYALSDKRYSNKRSNYTSSDDASTSGITSHCRSSNSNDSKNVAAVNLSPSITNDDGHKRKRTYSSDKSKFMSDTTDKQSHMNKSEKNDDLAMSKWRDTILPLLQYCGSCAQCRIKPCNQCRLCTLIPITTISNKTNDPSSINNKRFKSSRKYCIFNCCCFNDNELFKKITEMSKNNSKRTKNIDGSTSIGASNTTISTSSRINHMYDRQKVYQWYSSEIAHTIRKVEQHLIQYHVRNSDTFRYNIDDNVYCYWPESKSYFEAKITHRYRSNNLYARVPLYSVHFTDGSDDVRRHVPEREILSIFQMDLLLEADRIEDKLKECTSLLPSMIQVDVADSHLVTESQEFSRIEANVDSELSKNIENDTPSAPENVEASIMDSTNPQYACLGGSDENICVSQERPKKIRSFSKIKRLGARCCFAWPDETSQYMYWGTILESSADDKVQKIYVIRPEDSQLPRRLEIPSERVLSETNYIKIHKKFPPEPPNSTSSNLLETSVTPLCTTSGITPLANPLLISECISQKAPVRKRELSCRKKVGSRCYARWPGDGTYFWGFITKTVGNSSYRRYSIRFDDGDTCDDILPEHVFSEADYKRIEGKDPPAPSSDRYNHPLSGFGFCRKWIDVNGFTRTTFGKIGRFLESLDDASNAQFEVTYYDDGTNNEVDLSSTMKNDRISEKVAWGGYVAYLAEIEPVPQPAPQNLPFHLKWIAPDRRYYHSAGQLRMELRGFRLILTAEQSSIPGAGLGLFLNVLEVSGKGRSHLVLTQGELICLGPYGPLRLEDRKSHAVFDVKSFIHDFAPESYCFDAHYDNKDIFVDITDDHNGQLHDLAKASLMCRVNEVDDVEIPSVCADRDPSGAIHYYLGHDRDGCGDLKIPVNTPFELKIDYGELYERQRVRFGYPRIKGDKLTAMKKSIETLDCDQIRDLNFYSPNDIVECIAFLESLFCPMWESTVKQKQRALIVVLAFHNRITKIKANGSINGKDDSLDGYEEIENHGTCHRLQRLVQSLCDSLGRGEIFRQTIVSNELLKAIILETFTFGSSIQIDDIPAEGLYTRISTLSNSI